MIQDIASFIGYFEGIRRRTLNYVRAIPADRLEWQPFSAEMTCGDIVRHIAAAEQMYAGLVAEGRWLYRGHTREPDQDLATLVGALEAGHAQAMARLRGLPDSALGELRPALGGGPPIKIWRWLMAMVEHEVHHRSQLAVHLALIGIAPPQIYGMGVEDVIARATG
jgi:uncharacterized damage-inducible protein DinB